MTETCSRWGCEEPIREESTFCSTVCGKQAASVDRIVEALGEDHPLMSVGL